MRLRLSAGVIALLTLCLPVSDALGAWGDMDDDPSGGYTWIDNSDPSDDFLNQFPSQVWDFQALTTGAVLSPTWDDSSVSLPISFGTAFKFYGTTRTTVYINSNGQIVMSTSSTDYDANPIPDTRTPNGCAAALWDDLVSGATGTIYAGYRTITATTRTGDQSRVIQWSGTEQYADRNPDTSENVGTFQVMLIEPPNAILSSPIVFKYEAMGTANEWPGSGEDAGKISVGIENWAGDKGVPYISYERRYPASGIRVVFFQPGGARPVAGAPYYVNGVEEATGASQPVTFSALYSDGDAHSAMRWQIEVSEDSTFDPAYAVWDNGTTGDPFSPYVASGNRVNMPYHNGADHPKDERLMTGTTYYWRVRIRDESGSLSEWGTATYSFTVAESKGEGRSHSCLLETNAPLGLTCEALVLVFGVGSLVCLGILLRLRRKGAVLQ